ncbi:MAG: hypothetical protein JXR97_04890 [Planctomycetes bacterium]|nr:hypothetical protein [Planctomycetota bacterium]
MKEEFINAICEKGEEAIAEFIKVVDCEIRAFGIDFDLGNECLGFCFDTDEHHQLELDFIKEHLSRFTDYVEGETPLEHIGCWRYQSCVVDEDDEDYDEDEEDEEDEQEKFILEFLDEFIDEDSRDDESYYELRTKMIRDGIAEALQRIIQTELFQQLKKTPDFIVACQEHDDGFITIIDMDA